MFRQQWLLLACAGLLTRVALADAVDDLTKELRGQAPAVARSAADLETALGQVLDRQLEALNVDAMDNKSVNGRQGAQVTLQEIALNLSKPGSAEQRAALGKVLAAKLAATKGVYARAWLLRQLQWTGSAAEVPAVAAQLDDPDPQVSDAARRALVKIPGETAAQVLTNKLAAAGNAAGQLAFINALRQRGEQSAVPAIAKFIGNADAKLAIAAAEAVGDLGGSTAIAALGAARAGAPAATKVWVDDAWLLAADRTGGAEAAAVYQAALAPAESKRVRAAGLRGLARTKGAAAMPALLDALKGDDWYVATAALRFSLEIPGSECTNALTGQLNEVSTPLAAQLLRTLGERGDKAALPAVTAAAKAGEEPVRVAAIATLGQLGDKDTGLLLAQLAADNTGAVQGAARASLAVLKGAEVDVAIIGALKTAEGGLRTELASALRVRKAAAAIPALVAMAGNDPSEASRLTALDALAILVDGKQEAALVQVLCGAKSDNERNKAEIAVNAAALAVEDSAARAKPLLDAYPTATGPTKLALLRLLGRTGTPEALAALRAALKDADKNVQAAAVVGLSDWPDAGPREDLLAVVKAGGPEKAKALDGTIRMIALSGLKPEERFKLYQEAWGLAANRNQKQPIVIGLGDCPVAESLKLLAGALNDGLFADDCGASLLKISGVLKSSNKDEVKEALTVASDLVRNRDIKRDIDRMLGSLGKVATGGPDPLTIWLVSPAYQQEGKTGNDLADVVFAPEKPDAKDVKWSLTNGDPATGAIIWDGTPVFGDNKVIYAKTRVFVEKAQDVTFEMGSDDGIKVWLNGKVIHRAIQDRGLNIGEDKAKAQLKDGWNDILVKITNDGGNWSFAVQLRGAKGGRVDGLKIKPE